MNNENKTNWFVHLEFVIVLITILGGFFTLNANIKDETEATRNEILELRQEFCSGAQSQSQRTDRLYEMFIDLVKEKK